MVSWIFALHRPLINCKAEKQIVIQWRNQATPSPINSTHEEKTNIIHLQR